MGACTPSGNAALVMCWQWGQCFCSCPIFAHQQTRQRQIDDLSTLSSTRCHRAQVVLAGFAPFYLLKDDFIWRRRELQARSPVSWLPSRWLLARLAQAFWCAHKPIRGGGQVAIVAIFREPVLHGFQLLAQAAHLLTVLLDQGILFRQPRLLLLDEFVSLRQLCSQHLILCSQIGKFFFECHALTLLGLAPFGKSPAHLGSYENTLKHGLSNVSIINKVFLQTKYRVLFPGQIQKDLIGCSSSHQTFSLILQKTILLSISEKINLALK